MFEFIWWYIILFAHGLKLNYSENCQNFETSAFRSLDDLNWLS